MTISAAKGSGALSTADALVVLLFKDEGVPRDYRELDQATGGLIGKALSLKDFNGAHASCHMVYTNGAIRSSRILLLGLGARKDFDQQALFRAVAALVSRFRKAGIRSIDIPLRALPRLKPRPLGALVSGAIEQGLYAFEKYQPKTPEAAKEDKAGLEQVVLLSPSGVDAKALAAGIGEARALYAGVNLTKDLGNTPPADMVPADLAAAAQQMGKRNPKVKVTVLGVPELKKEKMGGILGVGQGSSHPPALIVMEYRNAAQSRKPLVFVGKGITFDSGGISLKPAQDMDQMKFDMCGAAAVIGAMEAIARLQLKVNVIGLAPTAENLPSSSAYRPGDVLTASNGKTIEVLNTDAEGRLILCDALHYATRYKPKAIVDLATLTGACVVALGSPCAGLMGNDDRWVKAVQRAGESSGDRAWPLPLWDDYSKMMESHVANLKNVAGREAGAITAAAFLKHFVGEETWAHLDIAGTAWETTGKAWIPKGATGYGVRLLVDLARTEG